MDHYGAGGGLPLRALRAPKHLPLPVPSRAAHDVIGGQLERGVVVRDNHPALPQPVLTTGRPGKGWGDDRRTIDG